MYLEKGQQHLRQRMYLVRPSNARCHIPTQHWVSYFSNRGDPPERYKRARGISKYILDIEFKKIKIRP